MMTLSEVAEKFEVSVPAMLGYVRRNLDEINSDGQHAYKHKGDWQFDEVAVERITKMREAKKAELWGNKVKLQKLTQAQKLDFENLQNDCGRMEEKISVLETQLKNLQAAVAQKSTLPVDVRAKSADDVKRDARISKLETDFTDIANVVSREVSKEFANQFNLNFGKQLEDKWNDLHKDLHKKLEEDIQALKEGKLNNSLFEEKLDEFFGKKFEDEMAKRKSTPPKWFWMLLVVQIILFLVLWLKN